MHFFLKEFQKYKDHLENPDRGDITMEDYDMVKKLERFNWRLAYEFTRNYCKRAAVV